MKKIVLILAAFFIASSLYADDQDASAEAVRKASEAFNIAYETNDVEAVSYTHLTLPPILLV